MHAARAVRVCMSDLSRKTSGSDARSGRCQIEPKRVGRVGVIRVVTFGTLHDREALTGALMMAVGGPYA